MNRVVPFITLAIALSASAQLPTTREAIDSKLDVWGEAALKQPGGPNYEFFAKLCPPLRYVDANFLHYPILLSAPGSETKSRFVSNGSGINLLARMATWGNEAGTPVEVHVGDTREFFGADIARLEGPQYVDGYLPIVQVKYRQGDDHYGQEAFASVDEKLSACGATLLRIDFPAADQGRIDLRFEYDHAVLKSKDGQLFDPDGKVLATFDDNWMWHAPRGILISREKHAPSAYAVIFTKPMDPADAPRASEELFKNQRERSIATWNKILDAGTTVDVPEPYINKAWRSLIIGDYAILAGDHMNYSAMNQYQRKYAHESGEAMRGLLFWGQAETAGRTLPPIFEYSRKNIELHDGAFKLMNLADYYWVTRDAKLVRDTRKLWQAEIDLLLAKRDKTTGLMPAEKYCSDIAMPVVSISTNASCWRGLRDMGAVLQDIGETEQGEKLTATAKEFREKILKFIDASWIRQSDPPFLPLAPSVEKEPYDPIT
ncbi:MAG TPA: hypothetical protein VL282_10580, partial [Tepidisphaeraceae bacterium]|nr:hypothetical protein [Tepidisphaeraceae bacterium]